MSKRRVFQNGLASNSVVFGPAGQAQSHPEPPPPLTNAEFEAIAQSQKRSVGDFCVWWDTLTQQQKMSLISQIVNAGILNRTIYGTIGAMSSLVSEINNTSCSTLRLSPPSYGSLVGDRPPPPHLNTPHIPTSAMKHAGQTSRFLPGTPGWWVIQFSSAGQVPGEQPPGISFDPWCDSWRGMTEQQRLAWATNTIAQRNSATAIVTEYLNRLILQYGTTAAAATALVRMLEESCFVADQPFNPPGQTPGNLHLPTQTATSKTKLPLGKAGQITSDPSTWVWPAVVVGGFAFVLWFFGSSQQDYIKYPRETRRNPRRRRRHA
jgi:hypothetical protein